VWQELDYRIDICRVTKGEHIDTCKVGQKFGVSLPLLTCSPNGLTIPATAPQRSEIPEGLMNYPVLLAYFTAPKLKSLTGNIVDGSG
jgi:hypothetical protein